MFLRLEGSEFSGGSVTGPLLDLYNSGTLLFVAALVLTFFYLRIAAIIAMAASLVCLPLFLYFTAPGPFRRLFPGEYSVPLQARFVWNKFNILGMFILVLAMFVSIRSLWIGRETVVQRRDQ
jgi:hypothetical protein